MTKLQLASVMAALSTLIVASADYVQAAETPPARRVAAHAVNKVEKPVVHEEPGDRARRELDEQAERLESAARRVTQTICRGC